MKPRLINGKFDLERDFFKEKKYFDENSSIHWHNCYEFDIVLSGKGETILNGKKYELKKGMVSFLSPMDFHEYEMFEPIDFLTIQFKEKDINFEILNRYMSLKKKIIYADDTTLTNMSNLYELLGNARESYFSDEYNKKILECIIISFLSCCDYEEESIVSSTSMQRAIIYLNTHFFENPSLKSVADMFYLNSSYFSRNFKKSMGVTYKEYLRKLKLEYSRKLIKYTDLSIVDIALKSGYETQSHFDREFKKYYNETPTSIRKKQ